MAKRSLQELERTVARAGVVAEGLSALATDFRRPILALMRLFPRKPARELDERLKALTWRTHVGRFSRPSAIGDFLESLDNWPPQPSVSEDGDEMQVAPSHADQELEALVQQLETCLETLETGPPPERSEDAAHSSSG